MEKYIVNGVELEYDTFDLDNMELYESEMERVHEDVRSTEWTGLEALRKQGDSVMDFFDTVVGEGTARKIFGTRMNIRDIVEGYQSFTAQVNKNIEDLGKKFSGTDKLDRDQRRAIERQKRRQAAQ